MIYFQQLENDKKIIQYSVTAGSKILVSITLTNTFSAPMVIQPSARQLDVEKSDEELVNCSISPAHAYLRTMEKCQLIFSFDLPVMNRSTTVKKFLIHFSSDKNCLMEIHFNIAEMEEGVYGQLYDRNLHLDLPIVLKSNDQYSTNKNDAPSNLYMELVTELLKGLDNISNSPSRNLITEAILTLCEMGFEKTQYQSSKASVRRFKRTVLFKNGVLIIAGSQLLNWLSVSNSMRSIRDESNERPVMGNRHLAYWENWFMKLIQIDLENENENLEHQEEHGSSSFNHILKEIGGEPDQFFLFFIFGLIQVSPKINAKVQEVCSKIILIEESIISSPENIYDNIINENGSLQR